MTKRPLTEEWCCRSGRAHVSLWDVQSLAATHIPSWHTTHRLMMRMRLLLDSRVVGCVDVIQPNCCHPFLLEALLFQ
jgi:hypothetical protein